MFDTDTTVATVHTAKPASNHTLLHPFQCALGAHGTTCERLRNGTARKMTASKSAATIPVDLTDDARSAGDRARIMWMPRMAVVGKNATAPSAAGTMRGIAISPGLPERRKTWDAEMRVRPDVINRLECSPRRRLLHLLVSPQRPKQQCSFSKVRLPVLRFRYLQVPTCALLSFAGRKRVFALLIRRAGTVLRSDVTLVDGEREASRRLQ
jgi:hypothetical protein